MRWIISLSVVTALCWDGAWNIAEAQHRHHSHGRSYWGSGHYHYQPGHFDVHRGHLDYHSGTTIYHSTPGISIGGHHHGHHYYGGYGYGSAWLTPIVTQPVIVNSAPAQPQQLPEPRFGAYAQVPRVAADLASFANNLCLTMNRRFQNQRDFNATYRVAYSVLQQAQSVRDLSVNSANREAITRRLLRIDEDMHRLTAEISPWVGDPSGESAEDISTLKQDVGQVGGALHYLMVDVGIAHKDQDPAVVARQSRSLPPPPSADRRMLKPISPSDEPAAPKANTSSAEPKFGAYSNVPKVSSDVAALANRLCLTMHRGFRNREDFEDAYAAAYDVLQQSQKIRDLARDPDNRKELAKRLEKLDDGMHRVFEEVGEWTNDPKEANNKDIDNLQREFGTLGSAVHFLMTDVGVQHHEEEAEGDPPAPPPKPKTPKPAA